MHITALPCMRAMFRVFEVSALNVFYRCFLVGIHVAIAVACFPSHAAEMPATAATEALTLEQAVSLALARTPQLLAQAAAVEAAQEQSVAAGRLPDPELLVGVDNLPVTGEDAWSV